MKNEAILDTHLPMIRLYLITLLILLHFFEIKSQCSIVEHSGVLMYELSDTLTNSSDQIFRSKALVARGLFNKYGNRLYLISESVSLSLECRNLLESEGYSNLSSDSIHDEILKLEGKKISHGSYWFKKINASMTVVEMESKKVFYRSRNGKIKRKKMKQYLVIKLNESLRSG